MTPDRMLDVLTQYPFPGIDGLCQSGALSGGDVGFRLGGAFWRYTGTAWGVNGCPVPVAFPAFGNLDDGDRVHAEIRRVLTIVNTPAEPSPTLAEIKADCVGPDLPADRYDALQDRLTDEIDRRRDAEQALAKITGAHAVVSQRLAGSQKEVAERDATIESNEAKVIDLTLRLGETQNRVADLESELAGVRDNADRLRRDLDFMNQRRANAQKRVTDLEQQRDDYQAAVEVQRTRANVNHNRADKAEARVKRLRKSINAAHAVLDEAGFAMPQEGKRRRPLAVRVSLAHAQVWDSYDCINAIDEIAKVVGLISPCRSDGVTESEVIARVKALRNDDDTRTAIAVAVGLDGSASLGMILDTVKDRSPDLLRLVNYHQAPIKFNARPLTLAERASFVICRLWQGRTNAANEATSLRRELGDIADALGDLPDTAEREPIGDREEHLALSTAERIRLSR